MQKCQKYQLLMTIITLHRSTSSVDLGIMATGTQARGDIEMI